MDLIRIGTSLDVRWNLLHSDSTPFPLGNYEAVLFYSCGRGLVKVTDTAAIEKEGNILVWHFGADRQMATGTYNLRLELWHHGEKVATFDRKYAFSLSMSGIPYDGIKVVELTSLCDALDNANVTLQVRKALDESTEANRTSKDAYTESRRADERATAAEHAAENAERYTGESRDYLQQLRTAVSQLPDGQAVSERVAEHTVRIASSDTTLRHLGVAVARDDYAPIEPDQVVDGKYIAASGLVRSADKYELWLYEIRNATAYLVSGRLIPGDVNKYLVHFLKDTDLVVDSGDSVIGHGPWRGTDEALYVRNGSVDPTDGAAYIAVNVYKNEVTRNATSMKALNYASPLRVNSLVGQEITGWIPNRRFKYDDGIGGGYYDEGWSKSRCVAVDCVPGDTFLINAVGGTSVHRKVWAFADAEGRITRFSVVSRSENELLTAQDGEIRLLINDMYSDGKCYSGLSAVVKFNEIRMKEIDNGTSGYKAEIDQSLTQGSYGASRPVLTIMHFSDIHGDKDAGQLLIDTYERNRESIDAVLNTGDTLDIDWASDLEWYKDIGLDQTALMVIGNHDTGDLGADDELHYNYTAKQCYDRFFKDSIEVWGVQYTPEKCYYYKDFEKQVGSYTMKVRLICIDYIHQDSEQLAWFRETVNSAKVNGYAIICASHCRPIGSGDNQVLNNSFNDLRYKTIPSPEKDALDEEYMKAIDAYISVGGTFLCWLVGHAHLDYNYYPSAHPDQLVINITRTGKFKSTDLINHFGSEANRFAANLISFDLERNLIKITRAGSSMDIYMRKRGTMCYDYLQRHLISNNGDEGDTRDRLAELEARVKELEKIIGK